MAQRCAGSLPWNKRKEAREHPHDAHRYPWRLYGRARQSPVKFLSRRIADAPPRVSPQRAARAPATIPLSELRISEEDHAVHRTRRRFTMTCWGRLSSERWLVSTIRSHSVTAQGGFSITRDRLPSMSDPPPLPSIIVCPCGPTLHSTLNDSRPASPATCITASWSAHVRRSNITGAPCSRSSGSTTCPTRLSPLPPTSSFARGARDRGATRPP
jgi:hypothetical protein